MSLNIRQEFKWSFLRVFKEKPLKLKTYLTQQKV
jgi:hypothetical protein